MISKPSANFLLRTDLAAAISAAKHFGMEPAAILAELDDAAETIRGEVALAAHYGGPGEVPPRLAVPTLPAIERAPVPAASPRHGPEPEVIPSYPGDAAGPGENRGFDRP